MLNLVRKWRAITFYLSATATCATFFCSHYTLTATANKTLDTYHKIKEQLEEPGAQIGTQLVLPSIPLHTLTATANRNNINHITQ